MAKLIMMRHGQSLWNEQNLFTGWVDVSLSPKGITEALDAGNKIKELPIDMIFTSTLIRAQMTAMLAMSVHSSGKAPLMLHTGQGKLDDWSQIHNPTTAARLIPTIAAWELNERMYGELQGLNKNEMREKYGDEQVHRWRRSYSTAPPGGESLKMTAERTIPYFRNNIVPKLDEGLNLFISAHGNSLRSIMMFLDDLSQDQVINLEIATGVPIIYDYALGQFNKVSDG